MYCAQCATQNTDEASFCRSCGANVSLIPQALTGQIVAPPAAPADEVKYGRRHKPASIENAVVPFFGGLGFFLVAIAVMLFMDGGSKWGFWMFIPAFFLMGGGVSGYLRLRQHQAQSLPPARGGFGQTTSALPPPRANAGTLPPRDVRGAYAPGSVTESTTKLLERDE